MPLVSSDDGKTLHYPKSDRFEFDEEVAQIFPDMARRAIPMYEEVHRMHASLVHSLYGLCGSFSLLDVGASRGNFIKEVCNQFQIDPKAGSPSLTCHAIESSDPMLQHLHRDLPFVTTHHADITKWPDLGRKFHVVSMFYVLQFIPDGQKMDVLSWLHDSVVKPGGLLLIGNKDTVSNPYMFFPMTEEYMKLRRANGYSQEEIHAKTAALKNSMWTVSNEELKFMLQRAGFIGIEETSRWAMFGTLVCKR